ncbi:unnamed protein product [Notodromas monacha]|uniref:Uncharacterized protein n=1 Tax=Notodromas monacha TaxID=399045 RepID=A0A7R9GBN5_9CRUS|nr:unnamed protein product [Notodromas monacha]CAG0916712.1 unnamed protein product [Notodromas monacha]
MLNVISSLIAQLRGKSCYNDYINSCIARLYKNLRTKNIGNTGQVTHAYTRYRIRKLLARRIKVQKKWTTLNQKLVKYESVYLKCIELKYLRLKAKLARNKRVERGVLKDQMNTTFLDMSTSAINKRDSMLEKIRERNESINAKLKIIEEVSQEILKEGIVQYVEEQFSPTTSTDEDTDD